MVEGPPATALAPVAEDVEGEPSEPPSAGDEAASHGYDIDLFVHTVDQNFLCAICKSVVRDAVTGCAPRTVRAPIERAHRLALPHARYEHTRACADWQVRARPRVLRDVLQGVARDRGRRCVPALRRRHNRLHADSVPAAHQLHQCASREMRRRSWREA